MEGERMSITFISAGAGSGKTHTLTQKIREEILNNTPPENILATTFTIKAAAEIRERVHSQLLHEKNTVIANKANSVLIGTINSVCGTLLSRYALRAGMSPDLTVVDASGAAAILRQVVMSTVSEEHKITLDEIENRFDRQWKDKMTWNVAIAGIVDLMRSYQIDPSRLKKIGEDNASAMCAVLGPALADSDSSLVSVLEEAIKELDAIPAKNKTTKAFKNYHDLCLDASRDIGTFRDKWNYRVDLAKVNKTRGCEEPSDRIRSAAESWKSNPKLHADIKTYIELIFSAAADAGEAYRDYKARNGLIDFTDQEAVLCRLLDEEEVVSDLKERLDVLLVDEFQDISPIQLALFLKLSRIAGRTWWIGDIKQAIYGFRGADSSLIEAVIGSIEQSGNTIVTLPTSYRSVPALVALCNEVFTSVFAGIPRQQVELIPHRSPTGSTAFMHWALSGPKEQQWAQIANGMQALVASGYRVWDKGLRPVGWNDMAVLVRSNTDVEAVCSAFRKAGIPLKNPGKGLFTTPEAVLLTACLKRLSDRNDTLGSAEILSLTEGLSPEDWLAERLEWLKTHSEEEGTVWRTEGENRNELLAMLESLRPQVNYLGISALLDAVIMRGGIERRCMQWTASPDTARERLVNIQAFRDAVSGYERNNSTHAGLGSLVLWIKDQSALADPRPPSPVPGVWISTWHAAKGLEWPVCLCYLNEDEKKISACGTVRGISAVPVYLQNPLEGASLQFWPWPFGAKHEKDELSFNEGKGIQPIIDRSKMEDKRLLYVGLTRARDLLVLPLFMQKDRKTIKPPFVEIDAAASKLLFTPHPGLSSFTLGNGITVPYAYWDHTTLCAPADPNTGSTQIHNGIKWFKPESPKEFPPAILTPSAHESSGPAVQKAVGPCPVLPYGPVLKRDASLPVSESGTAYHNRFAFSVLNGDRIAADSADSDFASIKGCLALLRATWSGCLLHTELSVTAPLSDGTGQIIDARLDLLVETDSGFYIVDHKLTEKPVTDLADFAAKHRTQLSLYRQAIDSYGGKKVLGLYLNLPQEGLLVEI